MNINFLVKEIQALSMVNLKYKKIPPTYQEGGILNK